MSPPPPRVRRVICQECQHKWDPTALRCLLTSHRTDTKLVRHVYVSLVVRPAFLLDLLNHVLIALPGRPAIRAGHPWCATACLPSFGRRPHLEASFVDVLPAGSFAPNNSLAPSFHLVKADGAVSLHRFAIPPTPCRRFFVPTSVYRRGCRKHLLQLRAEQRQLVDKVIPRPQYPRHDVKDVLALIAL